MLKYAFQLGMEIAFRETGLTKEAQGKAGLLRSAWRAATKTPLRKALLAGTGLGLGGLGTALALSRRKKEPSMLQRVGEAARGLTSPDVMLGLTTALANSQNLGSLNLGALSPQFSPEMAMQQPQQEQYPETPMQQQEAYLPENYI